MNEDLFKQTDDLISNEIIKEAAKATYQIYEGYVDAGFTPREALYLVAQMMASAQNKKEE